MILSLSKNFLSCLRRSSFRHLILNTSYAKRQFYIKCLPKNSFFLNFNMLRSYSKDSKNWVTIVFEKADGTQHKRRAKIGEKVQEVIGQCNPDFEGFGACDGTLSCSTCHLILSKEDYDKLPKPAEEEEDILDCAVGVSPTSRLGCALEVIPEMDGVILKLPTIVKDIRES